MKTKQMTLRGGPGMVCLALMLTTVFLAASSCKKNNASPNAPISFQLMADQLQGEILTGSITTESDEDGIALWCNNAKTLIGIGKITKQPFTDPGTIKNAQVLYCSYGIIIRDTNTNKTWYYIQNDDNSQKQFKALKNTSEAPVISGITGTIKLNLS